MNRLYVLLSVAGWLWLLALGGYVAWRIGRDRRAVRGSDVTAKKEPLP